MIDNFDELFQRVGQATLGSLPPDCDSALLEAAFEPDDDDQIRLTISLTDQTNDEMVEMAPELPESLIDLHIGFDEQDQGWESCRIELTRDGSGEWSFGIDFGRDDEVSQGSEFSVDAMSDGFRKLLNQYAATSVEKDHILEDLRGGPWSLDLKTQTLEFEGVFSCRVDLMGSVSHVSDTWLWAWANNQLGAPEAAIAKSRTVKELGEKHGLPEFTAEKLSLDQVHPDLLAWVLCGLCQADFYYWASFDNGAALVLGYSERVSSQISSDLSRVSVIIPKTLQLAGQYVDHRSFALHYLKERGFRGEESEHKVLAESPSGQRLTIQYDELGRLTQLTGGSENGGAEN